MTAPRTASALPVELVRVVRSGFHEGSHYGAVVVVDGDGQVLHARGPIDAPMFPRSAAKPFQATAMLLAGAELAGPDLALASASHSGEPMHTDRVADLLDAAGLTEADLQCPEAWPLHEPTKLHVQESGGAPRRIYMNCSGKHAGMLGACVVNHWDTASYLDPHHPLQEMVREQVVRLGGVDPTAVAVDGCGAPLFDMPLVALARAFGAVAGAKPGTAEHAVGAAMREYPEMVGGSGREDTWLMRAHPGLLVKAGAEGVHCAALADGRAVAMKVSDGAERARMPVIAAALRSLGLHSDLLDELSTGAVLGGGRPVGTIALAPGVF